MDVRMDVRGMRELSQILRQLPDRAQQRVINNAVRAGARVTQRAAVAAAPRSQEQSPASQRYGRLSENIKIVRRRAQRGTAIVSVTSGNAFWGHILEFGSVRMSPKPWMRPAADESYVAAVQAIGQAMGRGVEREAMRLASDYRTARRWGLR